MRVALTTFGRFSSGSPCPIITMFSRPPSCRRLIVARHQQHLAHDLARREAALQAHQRRHAELAIHRAAHLARNADGVALAFGHQHGLHRAAIVQPQQVAARAVGRFVDAARFRAGPRGGCAARSCAQRRGQRRDLNQVGGLAAIDRVVDLLGAVGRLIGAQGLAEIGKFHPHKRLRHLLPV